MALMMIFVVEMHSVMGYEFLRNHLFLEYQRMSVVLFDFQSQVEGYKLAN